MRWDILYQLVRREAQYQEYRRRHTERAARGEHRYAPASRPDWDQMGTGRKWIFTQGG